MTLDRAYLSPHPDDAVLSCGGRIALDVGAGLRVAVVTVFGDTGADRRARGDEDRAAAGRLGAVLVDLGLRDAPVRDPRFLAISRRLGPLRPSDEATVEEVRAALTSACAGAEVVAPLGVGQHIDHQIVHRAARGLAGVTFYEDLPYALCPLAVERRLARLGADLPRRRTAEARALGRWWSEMPLAARWPAWQRPIAVAALVAADLLQRHPAGPPRRWTAVETEVAEALDGKLAAIACYASQWPQFFASLEDCRARLPTVERRWSTTG